MLQAIQYNDDEGNQTVAVGEDVEALKAATAKYHADAGYDEPEDELVWSQEENGDWVTRYEAGMQYAIESVTVVR